MSTRVEIPFRQIGSSVVLTNMVLHTSKDEVLNTMVAELTAWVACENQPPFRYFTPLSWWDMFKEKHFTKWMLKRFRVKQKEHQITVRTIYPYLRTQIPPKLHGDRIQVLINDSPLGVFLSNTEGFTPLEEKRYQSELFSKQLSNYCFNCHQPLSVR